ITALRGALHPRERLIEVVRDAIAVALLDATLDARRIYLHAQHGPLVHGRGERLRATHAAHAAGQHPAPPERAAEMLARDRTERFVGPLQDALRADVDPRAGRHLAVHRETGALQFAELFPRRPVTDQVRVRDQDARR